MLDAVAHLEALAQAGALPGDLASEARGIVGELVVAGARLSLARRIRVPARDRHMI